MGQEFPFPRSDFQREMVAGQRCVSQQLIDLLSVYRIAGNQILLGTKFIRVLSEKRLRCLGPLLLQVLQPLRLLGAQRLPVQSGEQRLLQLGHGVVGGQIGAPVEDGITFPARTDPTGRGQHLQVMAHARLFAVKQLA